MKRLLSLLIAVMTALTALLCLPLSVSAESMYIRKIVSVVYDDSGSMTEDGKWECANYAMQAFCGLLNSEDRLYITYMSQAQLYAANYDPKEVNLSADKIQTSVDSIRKHTGDGATPYGAVEIAFNKLKSVKDANPNTQYWLVVITDGEFDEYRSMKPRDVVDSLDEHFADYIDTVMPNGTKPQVTFLGIGGVTSPSENRDEGIYTYSASDANGIIGAMSEMADKISGRTRLKKSDLKKIDDKTIRVSSSIPLLNIAVLAQGSEAKITKAVFGGEVGLSISRKVSLSYPGRFDLVGGAYLIGDSKNVIGSGAYDITFDREINPKDVIILFEPALEMRVVITVNGREISGAADLDNVTEGDKVSVSCKIYEMGTDTEVDPSLMPPKTEFKLSILEDGKSVKQSSGKEMSISDYVLNNVETEISAAVIIDGFNPIEYSAEFTPAKYVHKVAYSIEPSFADDVRSVKLDGIASNKDFAVCFTVYADGVALTNSEAVKALNPVVKAYPQGNSGSVTYSDDGKIVFIPNASSAPAVNDGSYDVEVVCTLDDGTSAKETYTVLLAEYQVVPLDAEGSIKKTEFNGNQVSASFYITKDGVKLDKAEVENRISVLLNEEQADLKVKVDVDAGGTITVTPYTDDEHILTFWTWWTNWAYYFGLSGDDVVVTLSHSFGTASSVIDVKGESAKYVIQNVYAPLLTEILLLTAVISYIVRYLTKARFASNGVLYVGSITRNRGATGTHSMELTEVPLSQYNRFRNLWNPFKELTVSANGVNITALKGNRILCNELFPWYSEGIRPKLRNVSISTPKDIVNYCQEHDELVIHEIRTASVMDEQNRIISQDDSVYYYVRADIDYVKTGARQTEVIDSAVAFCYSTLQN